MEQMNLFIENSWIDEINAILDRIIKDEELPDKSLILSKNFSKDKTKITSYSVSVKKPDFPHGINSNGNIKTSLFNIQIVENTKGEVDKLTFCLPDEIISLLEGKKFDISISKRKSDVFTRCVVNTNSNSFKDFALYSIKYMLDSYFVKGGGHSFGCCDLYEECSDAKKCIHENKLYARGCKYRKNLSQGKIFYGKNRNI